MYVKCMTFLELQKIKFTAVIDFQVGNRGIPGESPNRKPIYSWYTSTALLCYQKVYV